MQPIDFGPYTTNLATKKKDKLNCAGGQGFYTGGGNDILTNASFTADDPTAPGGYVTYPSVMSGGSGNDVYKFTSDGWGFIADGGGGKDTVSFPKKSPLNPKLWYDDTIVNMVLINDRDVLLSTTSLTDGGRATGIIFADAFGQYNKANQIEKVKFGNKKYSFKKLYKDHIKTAKSKKWGDYYTFSSATFQELSEAGVLNLSGFDDLSQLESGAYLDLAIYNNGLVV